MADVTSLSIDAAAHLIQLALTPVFLLSGIAALLNVYSSRQNRVSDRLDEIARSDNPRSTFREEITRLHRRSIVLDVAVVLGTAAAAATCLAIMTLFLLGLSNKAIAGLLLACFGAAVACTLTSIALFGTEMLMSSRALRLRMHFHVPSLRLFRSPPSV